MEGSQPAKALDSCHQDKLDNSFNEKELSCNLESLDNPQQPTSQQKVPTKIERNTSEAGLPLDDNDESLEFPDFPAFPFAPRGRVNTPVSGGKPKPRPK